MSVLSVNNLTKHYGAVSALNSVSFDVGEGEVLGILGPNGSGKTTLLSILLGVVRPQRGSYLWFGNGQASSNRKKMGALLQQPIFYPDVSAYNNLLLASQIKGCPRDHIDRSLDQVGLLDRKNYPVKTFSLGMKQRLGVAYTLLGSPEVLILDEPTNGLDPEAIAEVRKIILDVAQTGKTILLASHILDEVEKVCTHVAVLDRGNLLDKGEIRSVIGGKNTLEIGSPQFSLLVSTLEKMPEIDIDSNDGKRVRISSKQNINPAQINQELVAANVPVDHLIIQGNSLESRFLELLKEQV